MGSTSVGKSALTIRFINDTFKADYDPTIAKTFRHVITVQNTTYNLTINDTAGLEEQAQILTKYIDESEGFLLVYSISDRRSFDTIKDIYMKLEDEMNGRHVPIVVIGNKSDLSNQRVISYEDGKKLADKWQAEFLETSAKVGDRVNDIFITLINLINKSKSKNFNTDMNGGGANNHNSHPNSVNSKNSTSTNPAKRGAQTTTKNGGDSKCIIS